MWQDLEALRVIRGWDRDNPKYIEREKLLEKESKAMFKESARKDKVVSVSGAQEDRAPSVVAKWSQAATFRLTGARDYPRALTALTAALSDQHHPVCAPGKGFPVLKQSRNGNSMGKNYISENDETEEAYKFRITSNGEVECAPPTPTPSHPYSHDTERLCVCAVCRDDNKCAYKIYEDLNNPPPMLKIPFQDDASTSSSHTVVQSDITDVRELDGCSNDDEDEEPLSERVVKDAPKKESKKPQAKAKPAARPTQADTVKVEGAGQGLKLPKATAASKRKGAAAPAPVSEEKAEEDVVPKGKRVAGNKK